MVGSTGVLGWMDCWRKRSKGRRQGDMGSARQTHAEEDDEGSSVVVGASREAWQTQMSKQKGRESPQVGSEVAVKRQVVWNDVPPA